MKHLKVLPEIGLYAFLAFISIFIIEGGWLFFIELFFDFEYIRVVINLAMIGTSFLIIWIMRTYFYKSFVSFYYSVKHFKKSLPISMTTLIIVFFSYLLIIHISNNLGIISVSIHPNFSGTINSVIKSALAFITVAVGEEIVYRGFLYNAINHRTRSKTYAVIVSSLFFTISHYHYNSIFDFIIAMWLGVLLCILYIKYKSLYPAIFLHFGWNFSYIFFSLIQGLAPY